MTDETLDPRFERDLRAVLAELDPGDAPSMLYTFIAEAPPHVGRRLRIPSIGRGRRAYALLVAAAVIAVLAIGIGSGIVRLPGLVPNVAAPSVAPHTGTFRLYYELAPLDRHTPTPRELTRLSEVLAARTKAVQGWASAGVVETVAATVFVEVEVPAGDPGRLARVRSLLGEPGLAIALGVDGRPVPGGEIGFESETLFGPGSGVTATVQGTTLDIVLAEPLATTVAGWTTANVGKSIAITEDDVVAAVLPVDAPVTDGHLVFPFTAAEVAAGAPQRLVALLGSGPLTDSIREVAPAGLPLAPGITPQPSPTAPPTVAPDNWLHVEYEVGRAGDAQAVATAMTARLRTVGIAQSRVVPGADGSISVDVGVPADDRSATGDVRTLLGTTGHIDFVPLGQDQVSAGEVIDLVTHPPLFSGDGVASATAGYDQTGQRTVDMTLSPEAATAFASWTAAHIGDYFAIVLDGRAVSVPVIQSEIPDGLLQISGGGIGGMDEVEAQRMVAILQSGELPSPVTETATNAK